MPPCTATPACQVAPSPSGPESTQAITPKSKWRTKAVRGRQRKATRRDITASLSSVPLLPTGASTATTPAALSGQDSTGPTARNRDRPAVPTILTDRQPLACEDFLHYQS